MLFDFSEKVVLVTGASAGIGEATAILFAKYGAKLALVGRHSGRLRDVAGRCEGERGNTPLAIIADLATDAGCETVAKETIDHFGRLDVLVNNAGITARTCLARTDMATFDAVFATNVRGVYNLTRLLAPRLVDTKGNIVNVSSVAGTAVMVGSLPYGMAKAALDHFTRLTALELAPRGVRVNTVSPGVTRSRILTALLGYSEPEYEAWLAATAARVPMGDTCEGEDIAKMIVFLSSSHARLVTGDVVAVDGGLRYGGVTSFVTEQMDRVQKTT